MEQGLPPKFYLAYKKENTKEQVNKVKGLKALTNLRQRMIA